MRARSGLLASTSECPKGCRLRLQQTCRPHHATRRPRTRTSVPPAAAFGFQTQFASLLQEEDDAGADTDTNYQGGYRAKLRRRDKDEAGELLSIIRSSTDWHDILNLAEERAEMLKEDREASTAAMMLSALAAMLPESARAAKVAPPERPALAAMLRTLLSASAAGATRLRPMALRDVIAAAASFGLQDPPAIQRLLVAVETQAAAKPGFRYGELIKLMYTAAYQLGATLRPSLTQHLIGLTERRMKYLTPEELMGLGAVLGRCPPAETPPKAWFQDFQVACLAVLPDMPAHGAAGCAAVAAAGSAAGVPATRRYLQAVIDRLQVVMGELDSRSLVDALAALSRLDQPVPAAWMQQCLALVRDQAWESPGLTQEQQVAVLQAVALLGQHPGADWLDEFLAAAAPSLPNYTARESALALASLAKLGHQPSKEVYTQLLASIGGKFGQYPGPGLLLIASSIAQMPSKPPAKWASLFLTQFTKDELNQLSPDELCSLTRALSGWARPDADVLALLLKVATSAQLPPEAAEEVARDLVLMGGEDRAVTRALLKGQGKGKAKVATPVPLLLASFQSAAVAAAASKGAAAATARTRAAEMAVAFLAGSRGKLAELSTQQLAAAVKALAAASGDVPPRALQDRQWQDELVERLEGAVHELASDDVAAVLWGMNLIGWAVPPAVNNQMLRLAAGLQ